MKDKPMGMFTDMPFDQYLATEAVSASGLRVFARSPWHYKHRVQINKPTRPMLRGTLAHCALLEPDAMAARYVVVPEDAPRRPTEAQWKAVKSSPESKAAKDWWAEFNRGAFGREVITAAEWALLATSCCACSACAAAAPAPLLLLLPLSTP